MMKHCWQLYLSGRHKKALNYLKKERNQRESKIDIDPSNLGSYILEARIQLEMGNEDTSEQLVNMLTTVIQNSPHQHLYLQVELLLLKARIFLVKEQLSIAHDTLNQVENVLSLIKVQKLQLPLLAEFHFLKGSYFHRIGRLDAALDHLLQARTWSEQASYCPLLQARVLMELSIVQGLKGELEISRECCELARVILEQLHNERELVECFLIIGRVHLLRHQVERALVFQRKALTLAEKLGPLSLQGRVLNEIAVSLRKKGDLDRALNAAKNALRLLDDPRRKILVSSVLENIGLIYFRMGCLDLALTNLNEALTTYMKFDRKLDRARVSRIIGTCYFYKGNYDAALQHLYESLAMAQKLGAYRVVAATILNIGHVYVLKGLLSEASALYLKAMQFYEKIQDKKGLAFCFLGMAAVYDEEDDFDIAYKYYQRSLEMVEELDSVMELSKVLCELTTFLLARGKRSETLPYHERLRRISQLHPENLLIQKRHVMTRALLLLTSERLRSKFHASELIQEVISGAIVEDKLIIKLKLVEADLLFYEYQLSGERSVLVELKEKLNHLEEHANHFQLKLILARIWLRKARLAAKMFNHERAKDLLTQVRTIAIEGGFVRVLKKVEHEIQRLYPQGLIDSSSAREGALAQKDVKRLFEPIVIVEEVGDVGSREDIPVMFLILLEMGPVLYSRQFVPGRFLNDQLLGGFLAAINTFSHEAFANYVDQISVGSFKIVLKIIHPFILCYVCKGEARNALRKLRRVEEALHQDETIWNALNRSIPHLKEEEIKRLNSLVKRVFGIKK